MKSILLKKLELTNYRNIEHAVYEFNGNSKIVGDNRIGKTNTLESIYYLLTGYLLNGSSDIQSIKPLSNSKATVIVSGTFDVDGKTIVIEKKYGEDWVTQRNTGELVLKGHFNELWYNGTKQPTVRDFNNLFYEDFGIKQTDAVKISIIQLLTNPFYIGDLCDGDEWKEVRKFIIELVGDVSDDDVFAKEPMLIKLKSELEMANGRVDQVKKKIDGEIKGLKETLIADDAKIEMLSKADAPSETDVDLAKLKIKEIDDKIASLRSSFGNKEAEFKIKNDIADINLKIANLSNSDSKAKYDATAQLRVERNRLFDEKTSVQNELSRIQTKIENEKSTIARLEKEKSELLSAYHLLKNSKIEVETVCPTCNRPLDPAQIENARAKLEDANKTKMDAIIKDGKTKAALIEESKASIEKFNGLISAFEPKLDELTKEITGLSSKIDEIENAKTESEPNEELMKLQKEKSKLEESLLKLRNESENARTEISNQIYELEDKKTEYAIIIADADYANRQAQDKEDCLKAKKEHETLLVQKEQLKDMIQKFIFTKLQLLDSNVSRVFGNIKFQLIKENINGGFDTVCKPYIYDPIKKESTSVLWKSGSKSEKVATGIAIAEAIKLKLELSNMPYLFDEGGELSEETIKTRLLTNSQIICVKVQDNITSPLVLNL